MESSGLVGADKLLELLFPHEPDRPTKRWLELRCRDGTVPYIKLGRLVWFNPPEVIEALKTNHTIQRRRR
jgi:hypothetical protein